MLDLEIEMLLFTVISHLFWIVRKTYSLCATRSLLVIIIKVFRLQRKTLLLFFGFFFPIIIKVFRFQRKTLLLFYCFFFSIIIFFFSYRFCPEDFSETARSIFMKLSGMIDDNKNLIYFFLFWWRHFRSQNIVILLIFRGSFVRASPPKRLKISHSNFQEW